MTHRGLERPFVNVARAHAANKLHELFQVELLVAIRVHLVDITGHLTRRGTDTKISTA